jgi:hypothetical protein
MAEQAAIPFVVQVGIDMPRSASSREPRRSRRLAEPLALDIFGIFLT